MILGIETSCDETAVAILDENLSVKANCISSQMKQHQRFGGVVPELASRMHTEKINGILHLAMKTAGCTWSDFSLCAVTAGPGLEGSLLMGVLAAQVISRAKGIPLVGVNHLHGHLYAPFLGEKKPRFPFVGLLISGGHTLLVLVQDHFKFRLLGETRDDACGEAFDKVARLLGLPYPGGPEVEKIARNGNPKATTFTRALPQGLDFSFSGLKTAVAQLVAASENIEAADVAASFQACVSDTLVKKSMTACETFSATDLVVSGGVVANQAIRTAIATAAAPRGINVYFPESTFCTDNAAMIAAAGYFQFQIFGRTAAEKIRTYPRLSVETVL